MKPPEQTKSSGATREQELIDDVCYRTRANGGRGLRIGEREIGVSMGEARLGGDTLPERDKGCATKARDQQR